MFDKIGLAAEKVAVSVSRRGFLGSLGRWAGTAALGVAGVLVSGKEAQAGQDKVCCVYGWGTGRTCALCYGYYHPIPCPANASAGPLSFWLLQHGGSCNQCLRNYGSC